MGRVSQSAFMFRWAVNVKSALPLLAKNVTGNACGAMQQGLSSGRKFSDLLHDGKCALTVLFMQPESLAPTVYLSESGDLRSTCAVRVLRTFQKR
jgi:hypothetical protein